MDVLLARFLAFGDVLLTIPVAQALRQHGTVRRLDLMTDSRFAAIPAASGYFDRVIGVRPGAGAPAATGAGRTSYDLLVDLHARSVPLPPEYQRGLDLVDAARRVGFAAQWAVRRDGELPTRGWHEHAVEYYARAVADLLSGPLPDGRIRLPARAGRWAAGQGVDGAVCLVPGARYRFKRWPAARYVALVRLLRAAGVQSVVVGHPFDTRQLDAVAGPAGCRSIAEPDELRLGALLARSGIAVTNNSGLMHLAQICGAHCVCIHSHTSPQMWQPWGTGHANITGTAASCDCDDIGRFEAGFPCGKDVEPHVVAAAVAALVSARGGAGDGR